MALTQHSVESAKPKEKPYELRDNQGRDHVKELLLRVQPSGSKTYYVQIARGKRERVGSGSLTLKTARTLAKEIIGKAATGHDFQAERRRDKAMRSFTLGGYLEGGYKDYAEAKLATGAELIQRVKKAFPHLLDKPMTEINDDADMKRWRSSRDRVKPETLRRELSYLKAILNHAVKQKLIDQHQLRHYRVEADTNEEHDNARKVRYLTKDEEKRLRAALKARDAEQREKRASSNEWREERDIAPMPDLGHYVDHLEPIVLLALNTGLRRGDLLNLKWSYIDLERAQITLVIRKSSHARRKAGKQAAPVTLPLSTEAVTVLENWQKQSAGEYVFPGTTGLPLTDVKKGFEPLLKRAQIADFRFHDLRHTFASRLVMAGVDLNTVRELMTHSDLKMTLVYAHLSPDHKAAALERAFGGTL